MPQTGGKSQASHTAAATAPAITNKNHLLITDKNHSTRDEHYVLEAHTADAWAPQPPQGRGQPLHKFGQQPQNGTGRYPKTITKTKATTPLLAFSMQCGQR